MAMVFAIANGVRALIFGLCVRRDIPWLEFGWRHVRMSEVRRLAPLAFAFMGFPMGNALNLSGTRMMAGYAALGSTGVASLQLGSGQSPAGGAAEMVQLINSTFEPEFTIVLHGASRSGPCEVAPCIDVHARWRYSLRRLWCSAL